MPATRLRANGLPPAQVPPAPQTETRAPEVVEPPEPDPPPGPVPPAPPPLRRKYLRETAKTLVFRRLAIAPPQMGQPVVAKKSAHPMTAPSLPCAPPAWMADVCRSTRHRATTLVEPLEAGAPKRQTPLCIDHNAPTLARCAIGPPPP